MGVAESSDMNRHVFSAHGYTITATGTGRKPTFSASNGVSTVELTTVARRANRTLPALLEELTTSYRSRPTLPVLPELRSEVHTNPARTSASMWGSILTGTAYASLVA